MYDSEDTLDNTNADPQKVLPKDSSLDTTCNNTITENLKTDEKAKTLENLSETNPVKSSLEIEKLTSQLPTLQNIKNPENDDNIGMFYDHKNQEQQQQKITKEDSDCQQQDMTDEE